MTVEQMSKLGALMTTEGNLEVAWKTEVLNTTFASSQRLFQNLCMHQHGQESSKQCGGKTAYDYFKKLKVFRSKEPHEVCPRLWSKLTAVTVTAL